MRDAIAAVDGREMVVYEATIGLPASAKALADEVCDRPGSGCYAVANKDSIAIVPAGYADGLDTRLSGGSRQPAQCWFLRRIYHHASPCETGIFRVL